MERHPSLSGQAARWTRSARRWVRSRLAPWTRASVVSGLPVVPVIISLALASGALLVIASTFLPTASDDRNVWVIRGTDVLALAAALAVPKLLAGRQQRWQHAAMLGATVLITIAVLASGGGSTAMSIACLYFLVLVYGFFALSRLAAAAHLVVTVGAGAPALASVAAVAVGEQVVLWGVAVLLSVLVAWLVRAVDAAETDPLTGLPDRRGVERAISRAVTQRLEDSPLSLALVDVDHFKGYNESFGRPAGDDLLRDLALTWPQGLPSGTVLGRWGSDSFAVVATGMDAEAAAELADGLRSRLPMGVTASAGVAVWNAGESVSMLVGRTDAALYTAKHSGRDRTHWHRGPASDGAAVREGLSKVEFEVHFQPVVDLMTEEVYGAEALVRWAHPTRGLVAPDQFLPDAERSGAILELGGWVLHEACRRAARWPATASGHLPHVAVNASGRELQDPLYATTVEEALRSSGLSPQRLVIELVESDYDIESVHLAANLHRLRTMGVRTAIDDFGTGHSSLERLRRLGADLLKIDRSFVSDIVDEDAQAPLVSAVLAMAHALEMRVVAEGVETTAQARWLRDRGCELGQGWLFGRPTTAAPTSSVTPARS